MRVEVWTGISCGQKINSYAKVLAWVYSGGKGKVGIRRKWNCGRRLGTDEMGETVAVMTCCRVATTLAEMDHR